MCEDLKRDLDLNGSTPEQALVVLFSLRTDVNRSLSYLYFYWKMSDAYTN